MTSICGRCKRGAHEKCLDRGRSFWTLEDGPLPEHACACGCWPEPDDDDPGKWTR